MKATNAVDCVKAAVLEHHPGERLILHSDQGSQFRSKTYSAYLEKNGIVQSMSRAGNCFDNARIESFFGHMKAELPLMYPYSTFDEFRDALDRYILFTIKQGSKHDLLRSPVSCSEICRFQKEEYQC